MSGNQPIRSARWADPDYISHKYFFQPGDFWIGRNPHNADIGIGYRDDRHVLICAGGRSGKGRSLLVNNLALWPGSTVTYDPKGELPEILAARRGQGNAYCDGMGQDVFVLDPLNHSNVDNEQRAFFDPLHALDPNDGELSTWCKRIARSLVKMPEGGDALQWAKRGVRFMTTVIMHVVTNKDFTETERSLPYVMKLILEGYADLHRVMVERTPKEDRQKVPPPHVLLLDEMIENNACNGWIESEARSLLQRYTTLNKFFEYIRDEAADQLDWIRSEGILTNLTGRKSDGSALPESRRLDPSRLKTDPKGISVFIVMPVTELETYEPWVQAVMLGVFAAMRAKEPRKPKAGPVLCVLDEFSSFGYQEYLANSLDSIASSGMKLVIVVQNLGSLKKLYGDKIESFYTNCGLELYFGKIGDTAMDRLQKELGETEVVRLARTQGVSDTQSESASHAVAFGEVIGSGGSENTSTSVGQSTARSHQWSWSDQVNWSDSRNWGESDGKSMGSNYGPGVFHVGLPQSRNYGSNLSKNTGGSHTNGGSRVRGGSKGVTHTNQETFTHGQTSTWNQSKSRTDTKTTTTGSSRTLSDSVAETFHRKPLLEPQEYNSFLSPILEDEIDHPAYPGFVLVRIAMEAPFFLRRSNYDQDAYFERCFTPDENYPFVPVHERKLLGYEYTEDHLIRLYHDIHFQQAGFDFEVIAQPYSKVKRGDPVAAYYEDGELREYVRAPLPGRIVPTANDLGKQLLHLNAEVVAPQKMRNITTYALKDTSLHREVADRIDAVARFRERQKKAKEDKEKAERIRKERDQKYAKIFASKMDKFSSDRKRLSYYILAPLILSYPLSNILWLPIIEFFVSQIPYYTRREYFFDFFASALYYGSPIQIFLASLIVRGEQYKELERTRYEYMKDSEA